MSVLCSSVLLLDEEQLERSPVLRRSRHKLCIVLDEIIILSNAYVKGGEVVSLLGYARQAFALEGFEGVDRDHVVIDGLTIVELGLE